MTVVLIMIALATVDSAVCLERGHVPASQVSTSTMIHCPPRVVDLEDMTIKIYPNCNGDRAWKCIRCGHFEPNKPDTVVIWRRGG